MYKIYLILVHFIIHYQKMYTNLLQKVKFYQNLHTYYKSCMVPLAQEINVKNVKMQY